MSTQQLLLLFAGAAGLVLLAVLAATFFTVEQRTTAIVQRLGKFVPGAGPRLHVKIPFIRDPVDQFQKSVPGTTAKDVMNLVLIPLGLTVLASEFAWARELLRRVKQGTTRWLGRSKAATS